MATKRLATAGLIALLSMGIGAALLIASGGVSFIETLGVVTIVLGWFVVLPLYLYLSTYWSDEAATDAPTQRVEPDNPMSILKRRYADGEISESEFEHRLDRLLETDDRSRPRESDEEWDRELEYE